MADAAMLPLRALVEAHRAEVNTIATRHRGRAVALIGSVARGDETSESDIDFLVEFEPGSSLFDLVRLQNDLGELLRRVVDVISLGGLKDRDQDIRDDAVWL